MLQPFNVLRYQLGQHYDSHYDIFEPESYGPQSSQRVSTAVSVCLGSPARSASLLASMPVCTGLCSGVEHSDGMLTVEMCYALQMATILFYLSDVEEGGDTIFPLEGRYGQERLKGTGFNYKSCEGGYRVCVRAPLPQ